MGGEVPLLLTTRFKIDLSSYEWRIVRSLIRRH